MDVELASGDVIYVPEYRTQITILGEVGAPGSIEYKENMTILDLLRAANNVKSETADLAAATLLRDGEEIKVDLDALLLRGDLSKNIILAAGDRLLVPEIKNRTYVLGAVRAPGYYQYKAGDRVLDALKASGGTTQEANMSKITVVRMNKAKEKDGKAPLLVADIEKMKKGDLSGNILLEPGDMLFVPNRKRGFSLQDMVGFTFGVQGISGIFQLLSGRLFR
jgi:protein involved in polysaccharide export with SLBB domain